MSKQFNVPAEIVEKVRTGVLPYSAYSHYLRPIHGRHVIGVNNAYRLGSWIDICFFGDCAWYLVHRLELAKWPNLKISCCPREKKLTDDKVKFLAKDSTKQQGISRNNAKVSWNGNSGAAAISLAIHTGVKRVILLGFDMNMEGSNTHWHSGHGNKKTPPFARHLRGFPAIANDARELGVEIINANPESSITVFPRVSVDSLL